MLLHDPQLDIEVLVSWAAPDGRFKTEWQILDVGQLEQDYIIWWNLSLAEPPLGFEVLRTLVADVKRMWLSQVCYLGCRTRHSLARRARARRERRRPSGELEG